jgi:hypothetical protein
VIINDPDTLAGLSAAFRRYETALMSNDIAMLDALFWPSQFTLRYGVAENLYGHEAIARYRQIRPGGAPPRRLVNTVITSFGTGFGTANTEFQRVGAAAGAATPTGRQSQAWVRFDHGWQIVAAHVSMLASE